ncbi:hypothetical protein DFH28DRAFT_893638 [Melampsora americana]|nr:hypothetical protein DFH28DRAFT_893638 [Melampsora americana]
MEAPSQSNAEKITSRVDSFDTLPQDKATVQSWVPEKPIGYSEPQNHLKESTKSQRQRYAISSSKTKIVASKRNQFTLLQKIGILNVNRSSTLCYKIYNFFVTIHSKMVHNFEKHPTAMKATTQSLKNAGYGVVMAFLGALRVFEGEKSGECDLEILLSDGWSYLQETLEILESAEIDDLRFGEVTKLDPALATNSKFLLRYLKDFECTNHIPVSLVYSLCQDWASRRQRFKIPRGPQYPYVGKIDEIYKTDSNSIQGGLYQRMGIRNHAFWGPDQFTRRPWYVYGYTVRETQKMLVLGSTAAQFHTPIGREMCKLVHMFFEELIQDLQISYKELKGYKHSQTLPAEALRQIDMIIKAVSLAEYQVTVVIIGAIRLLNQQHLNELQLQRLLENAWNFLRKVFSGWKLLRLDREISKNFFSYESVRVNVRDGLSDPQTMFWALAGFKGKYSFPQQCILHLLRSWRSSISDIKPGSKEYLGFQVTHIPKGRFEDWNLTL